MRNIILKNAATLILILSLATSACSDQKSYAELLKEEKTAIQDFIIAEGIEVLDNYPTDSTFKEKQYVKVAGSTESIYLHVISKGDKQRAKTNYDISVKITKVIDLKTKETVTGLSENPYPFVFKFNNYSGNTYACEALQIPLAFLGNGAEVRMIIPSKIGYSAFLTTVTPLYIDKIKYGF